LIVEQLENRNNIKIMDKFRQSFLIISKRNGEKIITNFKDKTETETTYNRIITLIDK
jgi:hypothetical protein